MIMLCNKFVILLFFFTDIGVKYVASYCLHLRELSVSDCVQISDFGIYEVAKLGPNLRYLSVAKCNQITDAGVKQIARLCYKLRYLNVRGCESVSDDAIEMLARSCSRLRSLDIGKCDVTDLGLKMLSEHCPNLKKLSVKSCDMVSDKGIQSVAYYCRGLQQLNIQDCPVTVEGYRTVKKFCKRCIIEHSHPGFFWKKVKLNVNNDSAFFVQRTMSLNLVCCSHNIAIFSKCRDLFDQKMFKFYVLNKMAVLVTLFIFLINFYLWKFNCFFISNNSRDSNTDIIRICPYYCVYTTWRMTYFPSLFPLPYTKVSPILSLMLLPILTVS